MVKISNLPSLTSPASDDKLPIVDTSGNITTYTTPQKLFENAPASSIPTASIEISDGWSSLGDIPDTVTANGNRSYDLVFNNEDHTDVLSNGMRLKMTRTVTAPTRCTDLEASSSQYFSKSSPAGMTFTDDFVVSAWVKLESYATITTIISRYNGTSGWELKVGALGVADGRIQITGYNASAANYSLAVSAQSVPLNKWVHIAAQLDMSAFTATTTTSYIMIDGVNVPASVGRGGTNPTALIQAGDLEVGGSDGGLRPFDGKIAQVAIYSAKVTQDTILASMNQTLTGSETSLISAYTFNNSIADLSANANNLTANGSAVATATDSPFAGGSVGTTEYGIITAAAFSTDTTLTVQVPEGYAIPTTGGVSAVLYSTNKIPYGFPAARNKWELVTVMSADWQKASPTINVVYATDYDLLVPIGNWTVGYEGTFAAVSTASKTAIRVSITLGKTSATEDDTELTAKTGTSGASGTLVTYGQAFKRKNVDLTAAQRYYLSMYSETATASLTSLDLVNSLQHGRIIAECAYL